MTRLPLLARVLLRLSPVPRELREDVGADLLELCAERRAERGAAHAYWRLCRDLASLWTARPTVLTSTRRPSFALLRDARADLAYAARLFARQPGILSLAVIGLSLGLGIATSAFSVMNAAALRGEGLADPERAPGILRTSGTSLSTTWTYDDFLRLREGGTGIQVEAVLKTTATAARFSGDDAAPSANVAFVSDGFFASTGGRALAGRLLDSAGEREGAVTPVVVSHAFWTSALQRDAAVVGRRMRVGRAEAVIVGVAARGFTVPNTALWLPLGAYGAVFGTAGGAPAAGLQLFGRLGPDTTLAEADAQLDGVAASLPRVVGSAQQSTGVQLDTHAGLGRMPASQNTGITVLVFAVIALVLVLACANVATVLVSTAITREREMGVRAALGAGRGRIVRQLVTESLALGAIAALGGLLFAAWTIPVIGSMIGAAPGTDLAPDLTVYVFLGVVTILASIGAGLAPAWHGRGVDLLTPLKGGEGARHAKVAPRRLRSMLVMAQAGISVLLIVLSALFVRATVRAASIDIGFDSAGLYDVDSGAGDVFADEGAASMRFRARALPVLREVPGISVSVAEMTPFSGISRTAITREEPARVISFTGADAGFFDTLGVRVLAGRTFTSAEVAARAPVAVISQALAQAYWPDRSPLGELLPSAIPASPARPVVVGVVADAITANLQERGVLAVYEPLSAEGEKYAQLMLRVAPDAPGALEQASQRLRSLDSYGEARFLSIAARVRQEESRPRMLAAITGVVGVVALILCVIGLYGLTASVVGQRAREMGVRVALGAAPPDLLRLLMWESLRPVVIGLAAGAAAAVMAGRVVVAAMFFGVSPQDPIALAGAMSMLLAAAAVAVLVPARRAAAIDPVTVLRRS